MPDDATLLRRYATERSEAAFAELVRRHLDRVYSAARRRVGGDGPLAEDVTQTVFAALARRAAALARHPHLSGWLYLTTRNAAANVVRHERRRKARELEAQAMHDISSPVASEPDWSRVAPILDAAIDELSSGDRTAVLLRFVDQCAFAEIGARLRLTEDAARRRVDRALDKLRERLARRGITSSSAALVLALANHAVAAAPASLAATITGTAMAVAPALGASKIELLQIMTTTKLAGSIATVALLIVALGTATYEMRGRHAAEAALAAANRDYAARVAKLHDLEQRAHVAEQDLAQSEKTLAEALATQATEARATAAAQAAQEAAAWNPVAEGTAFMARHPEVRQALNDYAKARVNFKYRRLYEALHLTPAQLAQFQALMGRGLGMGTDGPEGKDFSLRVGAGDFGPGEYGRLLRDLLGEEGAQKVLRFNWGMDERETAAKVAGALWSTDTPLTPEQADQLVQIMVKNSAAGVKGSTFPGHDWDAIIAKAEPFLSAAQLDVLRGMQAEEQFNQAINRPTFTTPTTASSATGTPSK